MPTSYYFLLTQGELMKTFSNNTQAHKHPQHARGGGGYIISLNASTEFIHSHTDSTPCHTDLALSHTDSLSCHTDLERSEREVSSSQIQNTFSTTSAKRKRFIPSTLPLAQKESVASLETATAVSFCNQGESLAISASSIKSAGDTTAPFESDFMHHEAGESRNERKACNIDSMDCHATAAAVSRNDSKATTANTTTKKLVLSISLVLAAALELAAQNSNMFSGCQSNQMGYRHNSGGAVCAIPSRTIFHDNRNYDGTSYFWVNREAAGKAVLQVSNTYVNNLQVKLSHTGSSDWADVYLSNTRYTGNTLIKSGGDNGEVKGNIEFKVTGGSNNRIDNITHEAKRLNLKGESQGLTVGTLTQTTTGDSQIFNNTTVHTLDLQQGKSYQRGGTIDNLIINGGEFHQGAKDNITAAENEGTINNLILTKGTFKHYKGTIKNITLTAPEPTAQTASLSSTQSSEGSQGSDSSTTTSPFTFEKNVSYNSGSNITNRGYNGLIQSVTQQDGKNTATLSNGTTIEATLTNSDPTNRTKGLTINNETGDLTNSGNLTELNITQGTNGQTVQAYSTQSKSITNTAGAKITTLTLFDGYTTINNYGTITTITHNQSGGQARAAQTLAVLTTPIIINNGEGGYISSYDARNNAKINNSGRIGTLTLKEDNNNITNNPKYDKDGKLINGIIDKLVMTGGTNSINTLDGVAYNPNNGMSTLDLQGGTLAVDTLSVGLNGNVAKHRIDLSSGNGTKNGKLSVKNIEVAYVDGNFNPTRHINTDLKDYVSSGTTVTNQLDTNTPITFRSSEQLQNLGITFNADGTPLFKVEDSIAADMTSLLIRQSMRRKMLIDTYLAEQSRRSLKNKERRTKQRIEANVLAQSKEQYEKDLAAYKQDKAKWDKLANSKENKALIAQYEKEYKAYEKAFKQYEKDKAKWEKLSDKDKAKLADKSKAPIAPIEPKAPTKPTAKEGDKDYKQVMADFDKAQKEHKKALSQYQKALKQYEKDKAKWEKLSDKDKAKLAKSGKQAPIAPKEPTQPAILAQEPIMPIAPELHSSLESLYADAYGIKGDFFIRAFGGMGEHRLNDGTQTNSWSAGTLLGANWNLKFGNSQGNIGFYGGYEYLHNGYKRVDINAQGNTGFVGLRFSHLFAQTKLAGFYYVADVNGGYSDFMIAQTYVGMPYSARLGNINIGASMRLGSALYLNKGKSILFPSLGVGFEGGNIGEFELKTTAKENQLRSGGLSRSYAVAYAQANLNYYQEYGKRFSTTLGGGFRYLLNNEVEIAPTVNGIVFNANQQTGKIASVELAPFFYQGTFMVNYHTDNAGNFSVGYVAVGGLLGITHNASMRWHYFF